MQMKHLKYFLLLRISPRPYAFVQETETEKRSLKADVTLRSFPAMLMKRNAEDGFRFQLISPSTYICKTKNVFVSLRTDFYPHSRQTFYTFKPPASKVHKNKSFDIQKSFIPALFES